MWRSRRAGTALAKTITTTTIQRISDDPGAPRFAYNVFIKPNQRAAACIACRECKVRCPQHITISDWMPKIHVVLGENGAYLE